MKSILTRYHSLENQLRRLENDTARVVTSQLDQLALDTGSGLSKDSELCVALREEAKALKEAGELHQKIHRSCTTLADEIETRLRESYNYEARMKIGPRFLSPSPTNAQIDLEEKKSQHFAQGITFYKLFWVFFIGCFLGVVIETLWCIINRGHYESRVGLIYGPFNLVYGVGACCLSAALYRYRNRNPVLSFVGGFLVGSVVEYLCSWFQEMIFGSTSWDYSGMPFNINGRICLVYSLFWGILGVLWIKSVYPRMAKWILKIPNRFGKILTWALLGFMIFDSAMTAATVYRWMDRTAGNPPQNSFMVWVDEHYPDERMQKIFANLKFVEE